MLPKRGGARAGEREVTHDYQKRVAQLKAQQPLAGCYPRLSNDAQRKLQQNIAYHKDVAHKLDSGETVREPILDRPVTVAGRVQSVRIAGNKLLFIDVSDGTDTIQVVCQFAQLEGADLPLDRFKSFTRTVRKGDWYSLHGWPHKTERGEPSLLATEMPQLLAPSLHQIPDVLDDAETRARKRHVQMLVSPAAIQPLLVRHHVCNHLRQFFAERDFVEVSTPILTANAGGAVARPFETEATELTGQKLNLRIAPELWLKRLVVGGMPRVFEIGPAFRNEGVDATHNPEFTICEFYQAFATLEDLMSSTELLLHQLHQRISSCLSHDLEQSRDRRKGDALDLDVPALDLSLSGPYPRLEFLPALESALHQPLPDLSSTSALSDLLHFFTTLNLPIAPQPTLPSLLDTLATTYLEPLCVAPTFITHPPAACSPLAKHFDCPTTGQRVAARAELFIRGIEYANMYEEENSPFAQRTKFQAQAAASLRDGAEDGEGKVDEGFLEALEWGLPPTGGWGCGVDRLVMLFSGRKRLGDVLAFGGLRGVVGAGLG